jgi:hypothetical protein
MKHAKSLAVVLLAVPLLVLLSVATSNAVGSYTQLPTITVPGDLAGRFDISWVDSVSQRYYLADRTTGSVDVIDADASKYLYSIKGFVGPGPSGKAGPDGVLTIGNELWAGDGNSTVKVVDLTQGASATVVATIDTGGTKRADELAYDPLDHIILIANDRDAIPFVSFISQTSRTILAQLPYPQTTGGIEQPVWDPIAQKFYLSIPSTIANPNGEVDELSATTFKITRVFPVTCDGGGPAGLALLPGERLMTSCGTVLDARSGRVLANVTNPSDGSAVSGDEIWYNPGDDRVYFGSDNVAVVDASTYDLVRMSGSAVYFGLSTATIDTTPYKVLTYFFPFPLPTSPPVGTTFGGHTLAANSSNNHIFVPVVGAGVKVFVKN